MDAGKYSTDPCPIARTLLRVGDAWSMLILRDAGYGSSRFDQFRANLGIAPNILTRRLAALMEDGLLEKQRYSERPPRDSYVLTAKGRDFLPILAAMGEWGRKHHGDGELSFLADARNESRIDPIVVDRATGRPLAELEMRVIRPGA